MSKDIGGIVSALATPFDAAGDVDVTTLQALTERNLVAGVDSVVAGGGTGEVASLSDEERLLVFETVAAHTAGRAPVVANVGALTARHAARLAAGAQAAGADVAMLITPFYEPLSHEEIVRYVEEVADAISIPIMLYNNPSVTGINLGVEGIVDIAQRVDAVRYVKDSSKDWEQALRLIHHHRETIGLIVGWDSFAFSALFEGAAGVMAGVANVVPDELVAVRRALQTGDVETARAQWNHVFPVVDVLLDLPFAPAVKAGTGLRGLDLGAPRAPLSPLTESELARLREAIASL